MFRISHLFAAAALFLPVLTAQAAPPPPPAAGPCTAVTVQGTLTAWRAGPKRDVNGFFLDTDPGSAEVHFPPHEASRVQAIVGVGSPLRVEGCLNTGPGGGSHVRAETVTNLQSNQSVAFATPTPPPPPMACAPLTVQGSVVAYRYAPKGEVDGLLLGELDVRFPPHEGYRVQALLPIGSPASVTGCTHTGPAGDSHLQAQSLTHSATGQSVQISGPAPKKPRR
jgi:hypothetical protein